MTQPQQFGFGFDKMYEEQRTAHLPSKMEEAVPYFRQLIDRHHAAMLVGDVDGVLKLRPEARDLARKREVAKTDGSEPSLLELDEERHTGDH
jgi:hypothetical protein